MIRGELSNLRAIERADAPVVHRWLNDPEVMDGWGYGAPARSLQSIAAEIEGWLAQESGLGHPAALLATTLDDEPIGLVILRPDRPEARAIELSMLVGNPRRWNQGFGTDILRTTLEACIESWGIHRIGIHVEEANARAQALYRRFGFVSEGRLRQAAFHNGQHADVLLFSLLAPEWLAREDATPP